MFCKQGSSSANTAVCPNWLVNSQELKTGIFASIYFILLTTPQKKVTYWSFFHSTDVVTFSMERTISGEVVCRATSHSQATQHPWRSYSKCLYEKTESIWHFLMLRSCLQLLIILEAHQPFPARCKNVMFSPTDNFRLLVLSDSRGHETPEVGGPLIRSNFISHLKEESCSQNGNFSFTLYF